MQSLRVLEALEERQVKRNLFTLGLALCASLTTTATVSLPSTAWAQEESAVASQKEGEAKDTESADDGEVAEKPLLTRAEFNNLMRKGKLEELAAEVDRALKEIPDDRSVQSMNISLAMMMTRSDKAAAAERLQKQYDYLFAADGVNSNLVTTVRYMASYDDSRSVDEKLEIYDAVMEKLEGTNGGAPLVMQLLQDKANFLIRSERAAEGKELLDEVLAEKRGSVDTEEKSTVNDFVRFATTYVASLKDKFPAEADSVLDEAKTLAVGLIDADDATGRDFQTFYSLMSRQISANVYAAPKLADKDLTMVEEKLEQLTERFEEAEATRDLKSLESVSRSINSYRSRLKSALEREALIGTAAPEIDAEAFVATEPVTMEELKGKVVLIDFWAVWCGPCIATFPHLIEWHEEYADDGLVILGATKYYNYAWDDEAGKASRAEGEVEAEDELAMLEKFRESHGLHHGFFVSGKGSDYSKQFKVSGIPQAVLIDKEGKIAMIRVGSGSANAEALHEKIEELLN